MKRVVEQIADAVLYEGYILYPYRPSAVKNQQRWNFGVVGPEGSETMRTECLLETRSSTTLDVKIRFLHLMQREIAAIADCQLGQCGHVFGGDHHFQTVPWLEVNGRVLQPWQEAVEREVVLPRIRPHDPLTLRFAFPASRSTEALLDGLSGQIVGMIVRTQPALSGEVEVSAAPVDAQLLRLSVVIRNLTSFDDAAARSRDDALLHSFVSTHTILETRRGAFVSLLDPPDHCKAAAQECASTGTYPVLVGVEGDRNCMLSSPIILYDYPQIAPQSAGDLFDGTEIDEILTLRIMSLTDDEKREMRGADDLARRLLERTESLSAEQLMSLHGVMKKM